MAVERESATEFVLRILRTYPDRELQRAELVELCEGRFTTANVVRSLYYLLEKGLIVRTKDGSEAWWAISAAGLKGPTASGRGK